MLNACDRMGMLVLDELSVMWTRSKNNNDYAQMFPDYWEKEVEQMVAKDYNHPCVIMYISGNEIQEAASPKGVLKIVYEAKSAGSRLRKIWR